MPRVSNISFGHRDQLIVKKQDKRATSSESDRSQGSARQMNRLEQNLRLQDCVHGFQFSVNSILNTVRDQSVYRIKARIGDLEFVFDNIDWEKSSL